MAEQQRDQQPQPDPKPDPKPNPKADREQRPHHVADEPVAEIEPEQPTEQPPTTDSGLVVEDQIQKEWDPQKDGGLPTFLRKSPQKKEWPTR